MSSYCLTRRAIFLGVIALVVTIADAPQSLAFGQGKLDARYVVTLSGLPIGRGAWVIDIGDDYFSAAATGATAGLMQVFASGQGQSVARGTISGGQLVPSTYASRIVTGDKSDEVRMVISAGTVKELAANPPTVASPDRVPVTEAHRRGVSDPMTASLIRVPGNGDTLAPQACQRTLSIFDGRMHFSPIAGYVRDRYAIKYLMQLRDMEMWLAPIAGTRVMVPYRASVPTPIGLGVLQATQFMSMPQPSKATAKTQ